MPRINQVPEGVAVVSPDFSADAWLRLNAGAAGQVAALGEIDARLAEGGAAELVRVARSVPFAVGAWRVAVLELLAPEGPAWDRASSGLDGSARALRDELLTIAAGCSRRDRVRLLADGTAGWMVRVARAALDGSPRALPCGICRGWHRHGAACADGGGR